VALTIISKNYKNVLKNKKGELKMRNFLYHDYVVNCDLCNLKCDYCLSLEEGKKLGKYENDVKKDRFIDVQKALNTLMMLYNEIPAPILKISGGELFLFKNMDELLEELAKVYDHIQVLTNGILLTADTIDKLSKYKNISFNLSMDGHTLEMNYCRFKSQKMNDKLLEVLDIILQKTGNVEITSVITDSNAGNYEAFLEYLEGLQGKITAFPIPARGVGVQKLFSIENRRLFALKLVDMVKRHNSVTGPVVYYERLANFLHNEKICRKDQCFIPKLAIQLFDTGIISPCPLGWTDSLGNIYDPDKEKLMANINNNRIYNLLTHKKHKLEICKDCFAQTDLINLYLNDQLPLDELVKVHLFSFTKTIETLEIIYKELER
jgi:MoaA/NifB/PqqE/SkfB family radical SAM enzyme